MERGANCLMWGEGLCALPAGSHMSASLFAQRLESVNRLPRLSELAIHEVETAAHEVKFGVEGNALTITIG